MNGNTKEKRRRARAGMILIQAGIFVFLLFYFFRICPVVIYDCDDWMYVSEPRIPLPLPGLWNPTKVLPETMMPLCGWFAVHVWLFICEDYQLSLTIACVLMIGLCVELVCLCFYRFLIRRLQLCVPESCCLEVLFLIGFFLIFRNRADSQTLFSARDTTCLFNYTVAGLWNGAVMLYMLAEKDFVTFIRQTSVPRKVLFWLMAYLAIFSNVFQSEMLTILCVILCIEDWVCSWHTGRNLFLRNAEYLVLIGLWCFGALLELTGGRTGYYEGAEFSLMRSLQMLFAMLRAISWPFLIFAAVALVVFLFRIIRTDGSKSDEMRCFWILVVHLILTTCYLLLLCAKVGYMSRVEGSFAIWFDGLLLVVYCLAVGLMRGKPNKGRTVTLFLCILLAGFFSWYPDGSYAISTPDHRSAGTCRAINAHLIGEFQEADRSGQEDVTISVPDYSDTDFGPMLGQTLVDNMNQTLYRHGIIHRKFTVQAVEDSSLTARFEETE